MDLLSLCVIFMTFRCDGLQLVEKITIRLRRELNIVMIMRQTCYEIHKIKEVTVILCSVKWSFSIPDITGYFESLNSYNVFGNVILSPEKGYRAKH